MKNYTCVIVEDEQAAARRLERMLQQEELDCLAKLSSVEEAKAWFKNNEAPELIFLDIQLGDGLSFEIFNEITLSSPIIFTTAYDEYALKAFKLNSIDYLLKPIDKYELQSAIAQFRSQQKSQSIDLHQLQEFLKTQTKTQNYKERFSVMVGKNLKSFTTDDIEVFYSEDKASHLLTKDGRSYLVDASLDQLEEELDPNTFFRISRKYIVKHAAIQSIISYSNSRLKVELKAKFDGLLIVSRERVKGFKAWLG